MKKMKEFCAIFTFLCVFFVLGSCKSHAHIYEEWQFDPNVHWQICTDCKEKGSAQEHRFGEFTVIAEATETEAGTKQRICEICGYKEISEIPCEEHQHIYGAWQVVLSPTESADGEILRTCTIHPEHIERFSLPSLNSEDYEYTVITEPSCTKVGLAEYLFLYDGEEIRIPAELSVLAHSFGLWVVTKEATDTQSGQRERSCTACGFKEYEDIPPVSHIHTYGAWLVEREPTLSETGILVRICSQNSEHTERISLPNLTDTGYSCEEIEAATCGSEGRAQYRIQIENQEFVFSAVIHRLEHRYSEEWVRDERYHYHIAVCEHTDEKKDFGEHSFEDGICTICGYPRVTLDLEYELNPDGLSYNVAGIGSSADTDIVIPKEYNGFPVTALAPEAFKDCSEIKSVRFLGDIEEIGTSAFSGCCSLTSVYFEALSSLGNNAFEGCTALKSLTLPDTVQYIGEYAFLNCLYLSDIELPAQLVSLGDYAFSGCDSLIYFTYDEGLYLGNSDNRYLVLVKAADTDIVSCEIHSDTVFIYGSAFSECLRLNSITIPDKVISIGHHAFFLCDALIIAAIGDGVKHIGQSAFSNCKSLKTVVLPEALERIDANAFDRCEALEAADYAATAEAWDRIVVDIGNTPLVSALRFIQE